MGPRAIAITHIFFDVGGVLGTGGWDEQERGRGADRFALDREELERRHAEVVTAFEEGRLTLDEYLDASQKRILARARELARTWSSRAPALFRVDVESGEARAAVQTYAREVGVDSAQALRALDVRPLRFHALSLDATGKPVRLPLET